MNGPPNRPGFVQVPRIAFADRTLSLEDVALLAYLASHSKSWILRKEQAAEELGIHIDTLDKRLSRLRRSGHLTTTVARKNGKVAGLMATVLWLPLNPKKSGPENPSDPEKTGPGNFGSNKENTPKGAQTNEVIDSDDPGPWPALRVVSGGGT